MGLSAEFTEVLDRVREFSSNAPGHITFFRGHAHSDYKLSSQIFRPESANRNIPTVIALEKELYLNFQRNAVPYLGSISGFDALFHMQHHGAPTRLLDWAQSFSVALYFAAEEWINDKESSPHVWMLSPYALNLRALGAPRMVMPDNSEYEKCLNGSFEYRHTFAITPRLTNPRIIAQGGVFTVQGNSGVPLDKEVFPLQPDGAPLGELELQRIDIPDSIRDEIEWLIGTVSGNSRRTLFPGLDGVSADLRLMYNRLHPTYFV